MRYRKDIFNQSEYGVEHNSVRQNDKKLWDEGLQVKMDWELFFSLESWGRCDPAALWIDWETEADLAGSSFPILVPMYVFQGGG